MLPPPPLLRPMDKVAVVAGENMIVHCPVAGYPIDSIVWEKSKYYWQQLRFHQSCVFWLQGTLVSIPNYESAGPGSTGLASKHSAHTAGYCPIWVGQ